MKTNVITSAVRIDLDYTVEEKEAFDIVRRTLLDLENYILDEDLDYVYCTSDGYAHEVHYDELDDALKAICKLMNAKLIE